MKTAATATKTNLLLPVVHDVLLQMTERFFEEIKGKDTSTEEFLDSFSYLFWDGWDDAGVRELAPVTSLLLSEPYVAVTQTNLAIANANSNWRSFPMERAIANYLNDFLNYLIPRIINVEDWKAGFEKQYRIFEAEYLSDRFTVDFFGHIGNFGYNYAGSGELNDHSNIVVLSKLSMGTKHEYLCGKTADCFRVRRALNQGLFRMVGLDFDRQPQFFHYKKAIEKQELAQRMTFDPYELMRKLVLAIRLLCPYRGKPYCDALVMFHQGRLSPAFSWNGTLVFPEAKIDDERERAEPSSTANTWLERLWVKLEDADYSRFAALDHHIDDSLRRGWRGTRNPYSDRVKIADELERLSDYFSAFDSMYKTKQGTTTRKLPDLTGRLVTYKRHVKDQRNPTDWQNVAKFVRHMYLIRCDYEHGRVRDAVAKAGSAQKFESMVREIKSYLYQVAILYVMNDDFETQLLRIEQGDFSGLKTIYY